MGNYSGLNNCFLLDISYLVTWWNESFWRTQVYNWVGQPPLNSCKPGAYTLLRMWKWRFHKVEPVIFLNIWNMADTVHTCHGGYITYLYFFEFDINLSQGTKNMRGLSGICTSQRFLIVFFRWTKGSPMATCQTKPKASWAHFFGPVIWSFLSGNEFLRINQGS